MSTVLRATLALFALTALTGCPAEELAIIGDYTDDFGGTHTVTETTWTMGFGVFNITQFDNDGQWLIAQNDSENEFSPDLWSRFDWTEDGADLYFCQTTFDSATEQDAVDAPAADSADLDAGCGGFAWSQLL